MCVEIEAKLKVDSLPEVELKLTELGADFRAELIQMDILFDDANETLTASDKCLRLRHQSSDNGKRFFLTYKGAKEKSNFKKRQELEIEIMDAETAQKLLSVLGYEKAIVVEKKRRLWHLGLCEVALDTLPLLGDFIEIEGPNNDEIADVQNKLGLSELPNIVKSYAQMIREERDRRGI
jgi:adenylate cyclase class 2